MRLVALTGRLGGDAECKYIPNGTPVCKFSLAVDCYKGKDRDKETLWIRVTLWGNMAESLAPHLTKGKMVSVSGDLEAPDAWIGKQDGEAHAALNITGRNLTFCGGGKEGENSGQRPAAARPQQAESSNGITDEDIPF